MPPPLFVDILADCTRPNPAIGCNEFLYLAIRARSHNSKSWHLLSETQATMLVCCEHGLFRRRDRRISKRVNGDADQLRHALRLPKHGRSSCGTKVEDHVLSCERVASEGLRGAINNRHCATFERGGNAKQASCPAPAVKTMAHRNARRFSLATEPQFASR